MNLSEFTTVEKGVWEGKKKLSNVVRLGASKGTAQFAISSDILKSLGHPSYFKTLLGSGKYEGFLAFIPSATNKNAYALNTHGKASKDVTRHLSISPKKLGISIPDQVTDVAWEVTSDGLIVDISPFKLKKD